MISNQLLQKTIDKIKNISGANLAILETNGRLAVRTDNNKDIDPAVVTQFVLEDADEQIILGNRFFRIKDDSGKDEYVLAVREEGNETGLVGALAKMQLETLLIAYRERMDKDNFFKALLMDNMLMVDIFDRARKLHIDVETYRSVMIIEVSEHKRNDAIESVKILLGANTDDFVTAINKYSIIVIKKVDGADSYGQLEGVSQRICDCILKDTKEEVRVSYGSIVSDLKDISKSHREARMAMDVSEVFFEGRQINPYNRLGIGRLVYQLPIPLCKLFIKETFKGLSPEKMDKETITTINKFFENSLNVSETSRQLYIHRNTLVYRLDKIEKNTGLDLRVFEDAITFKIALMVSKYMKNIEQKNR